MSNPSTTYWQPLPHWLLKEIFNDQSFELESKLLGRFSRSMYNSQGNGQINNWDEGRGIVCRTDTDSFWVLVTRQNIGPQALRKIFIEIGLINTSSPTAYRDEGQIDPDALNVDTEYSATKAQVSASTRNLGSNFYQALIQINDESPDDAPVFIDSIVDRIAPLIGLGMVTGYTNTGDEGQKGVSSFKKLHWAEDDQGELIGAVPLADLQRVEDPGERLTHKRKFNLRSTDAHETSEDLSHLTLESVPIDNAVLGTPPVSSQTMAKTAVINAAAGQGNSAISRAMPKSSAKIEALYGNSNGVSAPNQFRKGTVVLSDVMEAKVVRASPPQSTVSLVSQDMLDHGCPEVPPGYEISQTSVVNHATFIHNGTPLETDDQGFATNPAFSMPGSMFTPIPQKLSSLFSGPLPFIKNPLKTLALVAIAIALKKGDKDKTKYSEKYITLPNMIIDNEELDNNLYGDQPYSVGFGPTPDQGQPDLQ
jgi:hypothetical protein